jgi:hypothetical protein
VVGGIGANREIRADFSATQSWASIDGYASIMALKIRRHQHCLRLPKFRRSLQGDALDGYPKRPTPYRPPKLLLVQAQSYGRTGFNAIIFPVPFVPR